MPRAVEAEPTRASGEADSETVDLARRLVAHSLRSRTGAERVILDLAFDQVRVLVVADAAQQPDRSDTTLSPREREIARMVAEGYPNKTIAAVLDISSWTVSTYIRRIFAKLGVRTRAAMVARVIEEGLAESGPARARRN